MGWEVIVCTNLSRPNHTITETKFRIHSVSLERGRIRPLKDIGHFFRMLSILRKERPDIVHNVALKPILIGTLAARAAGVRAVVNTFAGLGFLATKGNVAQGILKRMLRLFFTWVLRWDKCYVTVQNSADFCVVVDQMWVPPERVTLIRGSGVDIERFKPRAERDKLPIRVVMASRLIRAKGVLEFVEASRILRGRGRQIECWLFGKMDEGSQDRIRSEDLESWEKEGVLRIGGYRRDIWNVYAEADIVVLPSYYGEGVPKSLLEGAASGKPVVTTDTPGCNDLIRHNHNGLLVPPKDAFALASALEILATDRELRQSMGRNGRAVVERDFADKLVISQTINVYRHALQTTAEAPVISGLLTEIRSRPSPADLSSAPCIMLVIPSITSYFTFLEDLCIELKRLGWKTHLVTSAEHITALRCYKREVAATLHPVRMPRGLEFLGYLRASIAIRREAQKVRPDLIHVHFPAAILSTALGGLSKIAPTIGTIHGLNSVQSRGVRGQLLLMAERWSFRCLDCVFVLNESDELYIKRNSLAKKVLKYRSFGLGCRIRQFDPQEISEEQRVRIRKQLNIDERAFVFIFIGRQVQFKGFAVVVRAFLKLFKEYPISRLLLVGERDPVHASGLSRAEEMLLAGHGGLINVGWQEDVEKYLAISQVNVFPSEREGMPVNLMESLAMGVPIITIDSRGCRDVVRHNIDGIVIPGIHWVNDLRPEMLLQSMKELYLNKDTLNRLSHNARQRRGSFDRMRWVSEQVAIYREMLSPKPH